MTYFFKSKWESAEKIMLRLVVAKWRQIIFCHFFKCLLNLKAHVLQSEINKVSTSNVVKFQLQCISSQIEWAFEKITKFSIKIGPRRTIIRQLNQCKIPTWGKKHIFCKYVLLYTVNKPLCDIYEKVMSQFSYSLKMMSRNTFPEPQPDSASKVEHQNHTIAKLMILKLRELKKEL